MAGRTAFLEKLREGRYPHCLQHASAALRGDRDAKAAAVAVQIQGDALQWTAGCQRADTAIVLLAVQQNGYALKYAADSALRRREPILRADTEVVTGEGNSYCKCTI